MGTIDASARRAEEGLDAELPGAPARICRALNRLTSPWSAPDPVLRAHRWLYERTGGRIGHGLIGAPALLLYTTGRRSGMRRCTALCYERDGDRLLFAASNSGADRPPAWFCNVESDPAVELQVGRRHLAAQARVIEASDPDLPRLWGLVDRSIHGRLEAYQARTTRRIPLVALTSILAAPASRA